MTSGPSCAFCGRSGIKMSQEHVFPQWLSRNGSRRAGGDYIMERGAKTITTPLIEVTTKRVCKDCNTGWLSRIETGAKAVLEPLLDDAATSITEVDRWIIARWFTKTILTAQLAIFSRSSVGIASDQSYRNFYMRPFPPDNAIILISAYVGPIPPIDFKMGAVTAQGSRGFRAFFHFHRVVLTFFSADPDNQINFPWPRDFHTACRLLWPPRRGFFDLDNDPTLPCSWPPPCALNEAAIKEYQRRMKEAVEE
jgi:hypothetical protein